MNDINYDPYGSSPEVVDSLRRQIDGLLMEDAASKERLLRKLARPWIMLGYRVEELMRLEERDFFMLNKKPIINVHPIREVKPYVLRWRRWLRTISPYRVPGIPEEWK